MIDLFKAIEELNKFKGSEKKKTLIYGNKRHLVKFPDPVIGENKNITYINNAFSEYVGSNIFSIIGFETQNTALGTYLYNGKEKIVCACEDFTDKINKLYEFESIALSINPDKKIETELNDILEVIEESQNMIPNDTKEKFWDMFIVDSLIGNTDRHNGNWGFLVNSESGNLKFSPIYDCGSCLNPMLDDDQIKNLSEIEIKNLAINCYSCIKENGKKINYMTFISDVKNKECNEAILRMFEKIKIEKINEFIDSISCMSYTRKEFYKKIILLRYNILEKTYKRIRS